MGARAQVLIESEGVYLYTHWDAGTIVETVKRAVNSPKGQSRRTNGEYLARIIFCEMVKGDIDGETGYGIGTSQHGDIEILVTVTDDDIKVKKIY